MAAFLRKPRVILLLLFTFNSFLPSRAQSDSGLIQAGATAKTDTETFDYQRFNSKPKLITILSETVKETSGLLLFNNMFWTINDSGNPPEIYQLDSANGNVLRTVTVSNSINTDWESITQDDSNVYIGDFGNNAGNRTDLRILKITKADLLNSINDTVEAGYIHFIYPDQTRFNPEFNNTDFDCEAFFYFNDSLHLFSKDWSDRQTRHYIIPAEPGRYKARLAEQFRADGLITDASINEKGNIVLLGYINTSTKSYKCFAWLLSDYEGSAFFGGNKRRVELGSALHLGQTEGIVLKNDNTGWISSESIQSGLFNESAKLFSFDFGFYFGAVSKE